MKFITTCAILGLIGLASSAPKLSVEKIDKATFLEKRQFFPTYGPQYYDTSDFNASGEYEKANRKPEPAPVALEDTGMEKRQFYPSYGPRYYDPADTIAGGETEKEKAKREPEPEPEPEVDEEA